MLPMAHAHVLVKMPQASPPLSLALKKKNRFSRVSDRNQEVRCAHAQAILFSTSFHLTFQRLSNGQLVGVRGIDT